ncbi:aromatase/cyclase [Nocardia nova]|uniref:aromatase/cyclase n=1 Tax=Nocardia nova TaxID=37330 RepID=UPI00340180E9
MTNIHHTEHDIAIDAPVAAVYRLLSEVAAWPQYFRPTIHTEVLERTDDTERIRIWALGGDAVKVWTSRRRLDPRQATIEFFQEITQPPAESVRGKWHLHAERKHTRVVFTHDYTVIDDNPQDTAWLADVIDHNSSTELADLKQIAEAAGETGQPFTFTDRVVISATAPAVYDFINDAARWPERLPHVAALRLTEGTPGIQHMEMDTHAADGSVHTTVSIRVCLGDRIVYKQLQTPPVLAAHTGEWSLRDAGASAVELTSRHTALLDPSKIADFFGPDTTVEQARDEVRAALGTNSRTTMQHAKQHAERASRVSASR